MDIVERLIDTNFKGQEHMRFEAASEITRLREENKVLREALRPFAQEAAFWPDGNPASRDIETVHRITVGHLRCASAALATTGGE